ncbi:MAG: hypothetical protein R3254_09035, partial [Thiomicrorhabdus sp.]|nr:hypothetical protein [Thiomicrorhabdus sp.]
QVKALLDEESRVNKIDFKMGESDFQNRLMEYALSYDCEHLNIELDNLFNDLSESSWLSILSSVTKMLKRESRSGFIFWESQLLPRLQTRMRFAMRSMNLAKNKSIWIESKPGTPQSFSLLAALVMTNQGYYPYLNVYATYAEQNYKELESVLDGTNCEALAYVSDALEFDENFWAEWADKTPAVTTLFFLETSLQNALASKVNCSVYNIQNFA